MGIHTDVASICDAIAAAGTENDLPVDFFARLFWQESRFHPTAVSRAGAQGVAQFMPATANARGLADPFDPIEAIAQSIKFATFAPLGGCREPEVSEFAPQVAQELCGVRSWRGFNDSRRCGEDRLHRKYPGRASDNGKRGTIYKRCDARAWRE